MIFWVSAEKQEQILSQPEASINSLEAKLDCLSAPEFFELAAACEFLGRRQKAKTYCRRALEKNLNYVPSLYSLSLLSFRESKFEEAKRFFCRALKLDQMASESILHFQKRLGSILSAPAANHWSSWCLEELHRLEKASDDTRFELAKLLFEQSRWNESAQLFESLVQHPDYAYEVSQYLSYIYERIFKGEELIEQCLHLASQIKERADLFFNLGMIFQNDRQYQGSSLHFFYLAHREDPHDPGLRFSLEQACMEYIGDTHEAKNEKEFLDLMFAHLYYGSVAVAERYARVLRERWNWKFPESFRALGLKTLWEDWLLKDKEQMGKALQKWFGENPQESWKIRSQD